MCDNVTHPSEISSCIMKILKTSERLKTILMELMFTFDDNLE